MSWGNPVSSNYQTFGQDATIPPAQPGGVGALTAPASVVS